MGFLQRLLPFAIAALCAAPVAAADCPTPPPPYAGPLFDAMAQIDEKYDIDRALDDVRHSGVKHIALFARSRKYLGQNADMVAVAAKNSNGLVVLGAPKYFLLRQDLDDDYITSTLAGVRDGSYRFIGEILFSHGDKAHGEQTESGERYVDPLAPGVARFLGALAGKGTPVMTHWEAYAWNRDRPRFDRLYAGYPTIEFILPHMGFLQADQVRALLAAHPNLMVTMSKKIGDEQSYSDSDKMTHGAGMLDSCGTLRAAWRKLLIDFQDRVMAATDAHKDFRWAKYRKHAREQRAVLGQLPAAIARRIAWDNAAHVYRTGD